VEVPTDILSGSLVEIKDMSGRSYGVGFFNAHSLISIRLLNESSQRFSNDELDVDFFFTRLTNAWKLRTSLGIGLGAVRVVYGESDGLPGLVLDLFGEVIVVQFHSAGMELFSNPLVAAIQKVFPHVSCILAKNDFANREREGLPREEKVLWGKIPDSVVVDWEGIEYTLRFDASQKTGLFLDQRFQHMRTRALSKGKKVLDLFSNQGGFALNALAGGATSVTGVDISPECMASCKQNETLLKKVQPHIPPTTWITSDVFDYLETAVQEKRKWDLVIVDPPAFAKSKKTTNVAIKAYERLNRLAISVCEKGAIIGTGSCSGLVEEERFFDAVHQAAFKTGRSLLLLERGGQAPDHPCLASMPESLYLKWRFYQVN
jgi:23S rRNA (cytosine1962-C5)-methyltransferase